MHTATSSSSQVSLVRMDPGEDVLAALEAAVDELGIRNAVIVSGVGSLSRYRVHVVETTNMPPGNVFFDGEGPFDILSTTGLVTNGTVHAHITFSSPTQTLGGHLEPGCQVLTFAVVAMVCCPDVDLTGWDIRGPLDS